jgi:uncharacterized membrane protein
MASPEPSPETLHLELERQTYARVGGTLLGGLLLSIGVMVLGLILVLLAGSHAASHVLPLDQVLSSVLQGKPSAVLDLGILLLFATPLAGVIVALAEFARQRDTPFVLISLGLLLMLTAGFAVALQR